MVAGRGLGVPGDDERALTLAIGTDKGDNVAAFSATGFRENLHKVPFAVLSAGGIAGLLALMGLDSTGSWPPKPYAQEYQKRVRRSTKLGKCESGGGDGSFPCDQF